MKTCNFKRKLVDKEVVDRHNAMIHGMIEEWKAMMERNGVEDLELVLKMEHIDYLNAMHIASRRVAKLKAKLVE